MPDDFDWPDRRETRERREAFIARELDRLRAQRGPDDDNSGLLARQRAALQQANDYHLNRDPRSLAARLGYSEITDRPEAAQ
jgi:hypothetical protein